MRRPPTIRQWLSLLLAAIIVPATLAVAALFVHSYTRERSGIERANLDVARALMQAIDRELASAQAALEALATSPTLDAPDLHAFQAQAEEVLRARPGNLLVACGPDLVQLVNTGRPWGSVLPRHGNPARIESLFRQAGLAISNLYPGPTVGRLLTSVDVPVVRAGQVRYVLSMQYLGERLGTILERQRMPPGASATIYDGNARVVWSSRARRTEVGQRASTVLAAGLALGPEGIVDEGAGVIVFNRSAVSDWSVAIAVQRSVLTASLWRSLALIVPGALLLLVLGLALVAIVGARIEGAVRALVRPAIALGDGQQVVLPPLQLREAQDVGHAMVQAAALLRARTVERDAAAHAEQMLREAKRTVERSEAFLRGVFEETPDGILLVDEAGRVTRANARAERLFGHGARGLEGLALDELLVESAPGAGPVSRRLRAGPASSGLAGTTTLRAICAHGATFAADAMANFLPEQALLIVTVRDVSAGWAQEQALRHALEDKDTLLKELYHRVKNNLQLIISLFNLQAATLADEGAQRALREAADRVHAMALVHERLYQSATPGTIALDGYVDALCDELASAASAAARRITLERTVARINIGLDLAVPLGLLLNELVTNSLKHAFPDGRPGTIAVVLERAPATGPSRDWLRLTVSDDGIGLSADTRRTSTQTLGLRLVSALSEQLHGQLSFGEGDGASVTLVFRAPGLH